MINTDELRTLMFSKKITIQKLAQKVKCTAYILGQKISNKRDMSLRESKIIIKELDIPEEKIVYFFYK